MKNLFPGSVFLALGCWVALVAVAPPASAADPFQVAYFQSYPPFSFVEDGRMRGLFVDLLDEAFRRLGVPVLHSGHPWKLAQQRVERGEVDAFVTVPTDERRRYTDVSTEALLVSPFHVFVGAGNPALPKIRAAKSLADLKGLRVVDYTGDGWGTEHLTGLEVTIVAQLDHALQALVSDRADVFVQSAEATRFAIKQLHMHGKIVEVPTTLGSVPFRICLGKNSPHRALLPKIDEAIRAMRRDGKMAEIEAKYR